MRPLARVSAAALMCLLAAFSGGRALAHSVLLGSDPAGEAILERPPETVRLNFNEPVTPIKVRVLDRTGAAITTVDDVQAQDSSVVIRLPGTLADGPYIVTWRVVSGDSHPIGGSFRFSLGTTGNAAGIDDPTFRETVWETASIFNRALFYGSLLASCGGALFLLGFRRRETGPIARGVSRLAAFAFIPTVLSLPIEGGRLFAAELAAFADADLWRSALTSTVGRSVLVAMAGLAVLNAGLRMQRHMPGRLLIAAGALVAIGSLALTGHAATAAPRPIMSWTVFVHALAVALWFGALWPLLIAVRTLVPKDAAALLHRFSDAALAVVGVLILAGTTIAVVQVETPEGLIATSYGRLFLLKLGLVITVLLLALANRQRLTPRLEAGDTAAKRSLDRNIRAEIAVIATGLLVTATLGHVTPPRALVAPEAHAGSHPAEPEPSHGHDHGPASAGAPLSWTATSRGYTAAIGLTSGAAGPNTLAVTVRDPSGRALAPIEVKARFSLPDKGIEPSTRQLERHGDAWRIETADLALPGRWTIRIDALVSDFEKVMFETDAVLH